MSLANGASLALASAAPLAEATAAAVGAAAQAARGDHVHPRLTSTTVQTTNTSGVKAVTFTRTFPTKPGVLCTPHGTSPGGQPLLWEITSFQQDAQLNYIGCTVQFYRGQVIPQNLATLLLGAVFNLFGGTAGAIEFSCVAIMASN